MVYFSAQTELALRKYAESKPFETEYLFTKGKGDWGKLTISSLRDVIVGIAARTDVENVHLHRFRKTFATYMIRHGVNIQDLKEMMGHSSIATTNMYYAFSNLEHVAIQHKQYAN